MSDISVRVTTRVDIIENDTAKYNKPKEKPTVIEQNIKVTQDNIQKTDNQKGKVPVGDNAISFTKKMSSGVLIGGGSSAVASIVGKAMATERYIKPTVASVGIGVAIGTGIALLNTDVGDKKGLKAAKNTAGAALIAGGSIAVVESVAKAAATNFLHSPSAKGVLLGSAVGAGIALANNKLDDKDSNSAKNIASGALIGAGTTGIVVGVLKTMVSSHLNSASIPIIAMGSAVGAGIALANNNLGDKDVALIKNAASGGLIGVGVAGLGSSLIKTLATDMFSKSSLTAMAITGAIGVGIGIAATKE